MSLYVSLIWRFTLDSKIPWKYIFKGKGCIVVLNTEKPYVDKRNNNKWAVQLVPVPKCFILTWLQNAWFTLKYSKKVLDHRMSKKPGDPPLADAFKRGHSHLLNTFDVFTAGRIFWTDHTHKAVRFKEMSMSTDHVVLGMWSTYCSDDTLIKRLLK